MAAPIVQKVLAYYFCCTKERSRRTMLMIDRRLAHHIDVLLLVLVATIVAMGVDHRLQRHVCPVAQPDEPARLAPGGVATGRPRRHDVALLLLDYRKLERYAYVIYAAALGLLVLGAAAGSSAAARAAGSTSVLRAAAVGDRSRSALVIALARYFHRDARDGDYGCERDRRPGRCSARSRRVLILAQPDLGTAAVMGFVAREHRCWSPACGCDAAGRRSRWSRARHRRRRSAALDAPEAVPAAAHPHLPRSRGRPARRRLPRHPVEDRDRLRDVWGKGFLHGTQNQLNFLPEQHTDFIFSVFAEEWGFVGCACCSCSTWRWSCAALRSSSRAKDRFGALLAFGVVGDRSSGRCSINIGMTTGILPVVGITLPFFSYGGSSMLALHARHRPAA